MSRTARKPLSKAVPRTAYLSLHGWALGTLIDHGVITECEHHGHRRDRADPEAWNRAREAASNDPFPGTTPGASVKALQEALQGIGDTCPDC